MPVLGVGAVADPIPPVDVVYHNKLLPVADNWLAEAPRQYEMDDGLTVGDAGNALMLTLNCSSGSWLVQPVNVETAAI